MNFRTILKRTAAVTAGLALAAGTAAAQPSGTLNFGGSLRITTAGGLFIQILNGGVVESGSIIANTGTFGIGGALPVPTGTPGVHAGFAPVPGAQAISPLLTLGGYTFNLAGIFAGVNPVGTCLTAGTECTPAGSAINLENIGGGNSSATISLFGTVTGSGAAAGTSNFEGILSAQFTSPYQDVVNTLVTTGEFETTFSGSFTATPAVIPEPSTYVLMGSGILALAGVSMRRRRTSV